MFVSTSDNSFTRYWFVTVDEGIDISQRSVAAVVEEVLEDPKGWRKMGYNFVRVTPAFGMRARQDGPVAYLDDTLDIYNVFWIRLADKHTVNKHCKIYDRSCADLTKNMILLNSERWLYGSKNAGVSLASYQRMVCGHEIGHLLSFPHVSCPKVNAPGDVMQEFTRLGWQGCKPSRYPTMQRQVENIGLARRRAAKTRQ